MPTQAVLFDFDGTLVDSERDIVDAMADEVLFGDLAKGGRVRVDAADGEFQVDFSGS